MNIISDIFNENFVIPVEIINYDLYEMNKEKYNSFKIVKREDHIYTLDEFNIDGIITTDLILAMKKIHNGFFIYLGENSNEDTITLIIADTRYPFLADTTLFISFSKSESDSKKKKELLNKIYTLDYMIDEYYDQEREYLLYTNMNDLSEELFSNLSVKNISRRKKFMFLLNLRYQYNILREVIIVAAMITSMVLSYFIYTIMIEEYSQNKIADYQQQTAKVQIEVDKNKVQQNEVQKEIDKYLAIKTKKVYHEN